MWYDQMIQKLTTEGRCTAFNNEQSPYNIVIKGHEKKNEKTNGLNNIQNMNEHECVQSSWMPNPHYHVLCSVDGEY